PGRLSTEMFAIESQRLVEVEPILAQHMKRRAGSVSDRREMSHEWPTSVDKYALAVESTEQPSRLSCPILRELAEQFLDGQPAITALQQARQPVLEAR